MSGRVSGRLGAMSEAPHRKLAAILAADVAGYSRLMGEDEAGTLRALRQLRREIFAPLVESHRGEIVKNMGDGWLVAFDAAGDAVACAVALQEALGPAARLKLRIGVHIGDVTHEEEDIFGDGVNIAARLQEISAPGGILISDMAQRSVERKIALAFRELGPKNLKNIAAPVVAFAWSLAAAPCAAAPAAPADKPSIAVLPFANRSGDPAQDYFSDGITEDITASLSRIGWLFVIARNSASAFKGDAVDPQQAAAALGVQYLLQGSVRKAANRVRVTAQLIDARSAAHLWSARYDRELDDIFTVQDEAVGAIVHALGAPDGVLEKLERQRRRSATAENLTAYDDYLQGRELFDKQPQDDYRAAEKLFRKAIERDPEFAPAYSSLAWLYFLRFKLRHSASFAEIERPARDLALQALRLDASDYRAHWVLAFLNSHLGKHVQSATQFERALAINPNDANVLAWSSEVLVYSGQPAKAVERCRYAMRLNPNCPDFYYWLLGFALFHLGRYEDALSVLEGMTEPDYARRLLAAVYGQLGRLEEARAERETYLELDPDFCIENWAKNEHYSDPGELARYLEGLRKAGFPD